MVQTLRQRLEEGEALIGTFQTINSPVVAEIAGLSGMDFIILDQEHGPLTAQSSLALCQAAERRGASPVVRVRSNTVPEIQRALDIGASGVEIPQVETREDAAAAVDAARFSPVGERGLNPYIRAGAYDGGTDYAERQNRETTVIVQIEGKEGIHNLDDILGVDGIDVLFIGPYDLSHSLGIPGQIRHERVTGLMQEASAQAAEAGKIVGTYAEDPQMARDWIEAGAQYVAILLDAKILVDAYESLVGAVRSPDG